MSEEPDLFGYIPPRKAFGGVTYEPERDYSRLKSQLARVYMVMLDGKWRTLAQITKASRPGTEASVSARLRDLRKDKYGGHILQAECIEGGLWRYRLIVVARA